MNRQKMEKDANLQDKLHQTGKRITGEAADRMLEEFEEIGMSRRMAYAEILYHAQQGLNKEKENESNQRKTLG